MGMSDYAVDVFRHHKAVRDNNGQIFFANEGAYGAPIGGVVG